MVHACEVRVHSVTAQATRAAPCTRTAHMAVRTGAPPTAYQSAYCDTHTHMRYMHARTVTRTQSVRAEMLGDERAVVVGWAGRALSPSEAYPQYSRCSDGAITMPPTRSP